MPMRYCLLMFSTEIIEFISSLVQVARIGFTAQEGDIEVINNLGIYFFESRFRSFYTKGPTSIFSILDRAFGRISFIDI